MKSMQSFLLFFFILDQGYSQCKNDDLGGFLGAISPELWEDGRPVDKAIFNDWTRLVDPLYLNENNILTTIYGFLELYEKNYGYNFSEIKKWILTVADIKIIKDSIGKVSKMYQKYNYCD